MVTQRIKILYLSQLFTHTAGGGEHVFREYAEHFSEQGENVYVVCQLSNLSANPSGGVKIYQVTPPVSGFLPKTSDSLFYFLKGISTGIRVVSDYEIQLIHSNNFVSMLVGSVVSIITGVPHIATIHHVFTISRMKVTRPQSGSAWSFSLFTSVKQAFLSVSLKLSRQQLIIVPSKKSLDDLRYLGYKGAVTIVSNGITMPEERLTNSLTAMKLNSSTKPFFLFLGRHIFYKNLDTVIKAFKIVTAKNPEANLIVSGDGPMCAKWKNLTKDLNLENNIQFVGFINEKEKEVLLENCTALVFPSVVEGFGLTILEALAMAKPVLVADIEPINELVESSVDGYKIARYYDENEWAEKIISMLNSPQKTKEMGTKGKQKIIEKYLVSEVFESIENLYRQNLKYKQAENRHA